MSLEYLFLCFLVSFCGLGLWKIFVYCDTPIPRRLIVSFVGTICAAQLLSTGLMHGQWGTMLLQWLCVLAGATTLLWMCNDLQSHLWARRMDQQLRNDEVFNEDHPNYRP